MRTTLTTLVLLIAAPLTLAACGEDDDPMGSRHHDSQIAEGADFNQADVDFATAMIPHHAQALAMVDLTVGRELSPELTALSEQIQLAQGPEIETMADWLEAWGQPVPETMRDHANAHGDGHMADSDMPGMMSEDQMTELEEADDADFERLWLEMMIEHHRGAIEMARTEQETGEDADAKALADSIITGQQAEIDQMESMLGR